MELVDVMVVGVGGMGSAACYALAKRGVRVVGFEQFSIGHDRGSSHGDTRMIRKAYFEHPDYVPLLESSYAGWTALEKEAGVRFFHPSGLVLYGPSQGPIYSGVIKSAELYNIPIRQWLSPNAKQAFPAIAPPEDFSAVFEPSAGFLEVELCVRTHAAMARRYGARIHEGIRILEWKLTADGVQVRTNQGDFQAHRLVVTTGAWASGLLSDLNLAFKVHRQVLLWFEAEADFEESAGMPCFAFETPEGFLYGFPQKSGGGVKIADHTPGITLSDPLQVDRSLQDADKEKIQRFIAKYLPGVSTKIIKHAVCLYTMTPDENFVIDRHPQHPQVSFAAGFSGHGFKFCPVVGEILADFALEGKTNYPSDFLKIRPAVLQSP